MYLSFISDEIEKLESKIQGLRDVGSELESKCEDIIYEMREHMRERIVESIDEVFEEHDIEDNYMDEKTQETMDEMVQYVEQNI